MRLLIIMRFMQPFHVSTTVVSQIIQIRKKYIYIYNKSADKIKKLYINNKNTGGPMV